MAGFIDSIIIKFSGPLSGYLVIKHSYYKREFCLLHGLMACIELSNVMQP